MDERAARILRARAFAHVALADERGRPHVTPMWVDLSTEGLVVVNTAEGRVKARLLKVGAPVALSALDPETPYRYVMVRGEVVAREHEGADEVIRALSEKYTGSSDFPIPDGVQRVTVRIRPDTVIVHGG